MWLTNTLCVFVSVCMCAWLSLSLSLCLSVSLSLSLSLSLSVSVCLSSSLSLVVKHRSNARISLLVEAATTSGQCKIVILVGFPLSISNACRQVAVPQSHSRSFPSMAPADADE